MEEAPFVAKWDELATSPNVVVVPFFIADALHSYQDIPVLLGIETEPTSAASQNDVFRHNPIALRGRNLFYSSSIGTDPLMSSVILDQVADFDATHSPSVISGSRVARPLPACPFTMGQIAVTKDDSGWILCHSEDVNSMDSLSMSCDALKARERAMFDDSSAFRALKTAPTLRHGWKIAVATETELRLALECFYPGVIGLWESAMEKSLQPVPLRDTLGRQTGMYRFANTISDEQANDMVGCECDPFEKCSRRITWGLTSAQPLAALPPEKRPAELFPSNEIPLLCVEACTHLVSAAREIARSNYSSK